MAREQLPPLTQARINAASSGPATSDDQSRTLDGRLLDTGEKLRAFLAELELARAEGRSLVPKRDG